MNSAQIELIKCPFNQGTSEVYNDSGRFKTQKSCSVTVLDF